MRRGVELRALDIAAHTLNLDIHLVDSVVGTHASLNGQRTKLIGKHKVCRVNLSAIVEWRVQILLPLKILLSAIPILDIIVAVLAIRCELIAHLGLTTLAVVELIVCRNVNIPVVLALVTACTLVALARHIEHITLGVLQRIPVVAEASRYRELIAALVDFPYIIGCNLRQALLVRDTIVAVIEIIVEHLIALHTQLVVAHLATTSRSGHTRLRLKQQRVVILGNLPTQAGDIRIVVACSDTISLRCCDKVVHDGGLCLVEITLAALLGSRST